MDFWMKEFKPLIDGFTYDYNFKKYESVKESDAYNKILNVICENVDVNYFDKLLFIKNLHNLIYKGVTIPYLADIAECVYNNHKVVPIINYSDPNMTPDKTNTNNYLNECIGNTKVNIILDRFLISGYVYNKCIPIEFLYMIGNKFISDNIEIDKHDKSLKTYLIEKLFNLFIGQNDRKLNKVDFSIWGNQRCLAGSSAKAKKSAHSGAIKVQQDPALEGYKPGICIFNGEAVVLMHYFVENDGY